MNEILTDMTNTLKNIATVVILSILLFPLRAQNNPQQADDIIFKALTDELSRNSSELILNNYKPPFFISYQLNDIKTLLIKATMGSIRSSQEQPYRSSNLKLMVGDYALNDENFVGATPQMSGGGYLPVPMENDYESIRRAFWIMSDRTYKSALQKYEQKLTALKQQNKADSEKIDDYTKATPVNFISKDEDFKLDKTKWDNIACQISGVFNPYGDIAASATYIYFVKAWVYMINSEGAKIKCPVNICCLLVNAYTQAEDGEPMTDHMLYFAPTPDKLPPVEKIKQEAKQLADYMVALRNAPVLKDSYSGPVIFEGDAVAELFSQKFFAPNAGLFTYREPVRAVERQAGYEQSSANKFDNRIGQKICSNNLTIKDISKTKIFNGIPLVGAYDIDAEGIVPPDELVLVQNGVLKTLLNDRVPTPKIRESNGHKRIFVSRGGSYSFKAPGVINVSYENGKPAASFRKEMLEEFAKNGLEYVYVVKKLQVPNAGMINVMTTTASRNLSVSKPISIYLVSTKTGEEQLIRSAILGDFQISAFKQIQQGTNEQMVYNTVVFKNGLEIPTSFIVPQALVFDDISIEPDKGVTKAKLPVVPNPALAVK